MYNIKKLSYLLLGGALTFSACNNEDKFETTDSGLEYKYIEKGEGETPEKGQILTLNMTYKDANDSVWFDSKKQGSPIPIQYNDSLPPDAGAIDEGFRMLRKGDSVVFKVNAQNLFDKTFKTAVPPGVDSTSVLTFNIGVVDVLSEEDYNSFLMKEHERKQAVALKKDVEIIDNYLKDNNLEAQKTESGLRYIVEKEGTGKKPSPGDSVSVHYVGKLLDGKLFDTSRENVAKENDMHDPRNPYKPLNFVHGQGQMIPGFDEGVGLLKEGAQARLILPSSLAYGERGAGAAIAPNSVLIFEIELVKVK